MKKLFLLAFFALFLLADIFPQGWGPVNNLGNFTFYTFDVFTNKYGHHVVGKSNQGIVYKLYSPAGTLVRTTVLQTSSSVDPEIVGNENDVYAAYSLGNQIIIKKSTDGGASWSANLGPSAAASGIRDLSIDIDEYSIYLAWYADYDSYTNYDSKTYFTTKYLNSPYSNWRNIYQFDEGFQGEYISRDICLSHGYGYTFLSYNTDRNVVIRTYDQVGEVWNEDYEILQGRYLIDDIETAVAGNKLFVTIHNLLLIGTEKLSESSQELLGANQTLSRSATGGVWSAENISGEPYKPKYTVTQNGEMHLFYSSSGIEAITYNPSTGWGTPQIAMDNVTQSIYNISCYGNNIFVFSVYQGALYYRTYNAIPSAPTNLQITIGSTTLLPELTWKASEQSFISQYEIWGKTGAAGTWNPIGLTTYLYYTDMDMYFDDDNSYYYKIRARSTANLYSAFSSEVSTIPAAPTGVALSSSSGTYGNVKISWTKNSEANVTSYEVYRDYVEEPAGWQLIGTTTSNSLIDQEHTYAPNWGIMTGKYKVRAKNNLSKYSPFSPEASVRIEPNYKRNGGYSFNEEMPAPTEYNISQNYPNPFNPSTIISYDIPNASMVSIKVYDMLGREVADLVNEYKEAGRYSVKFDASHLSTGIYIYQIRANEFQSIKKMNFVK